MSLRSSQSVLSSSFDVPNFFAGTQYVSQTFDRLQTDVGPGHNHRPPDPVRPPRKPPYTGAQARAPTFNCKQERQVLENIISKFPTARSSPNLYTNGASKRAIPRKKRSPCGAGVHMDSELPCRTARGAASRTSPPSAEHQPLRRMALSLLLNHMATWPQ